MVENLLNLMQKTNFVGLNIVANRESLSDWVYKSIIVCKKIQVLDDVYFSSLSITALVEMITLVVQKKLISIYNLNSNNDMS